MPDVLELREIDTPVVGDDDVLVRVRAAGVDPGVWHLMTGLPYRSGIARLRAAQPRRTRSVAATWRARRGGRRERHRFQPGDEVFGTCRGSFAEYAIARRTGWRRKPANLTFEQAAAVPSPP